MSRKYYLFFLSAFLLVVFNSFGFIFVDKSGFLNYEDSFITNEDSIFGKIEFREISTDNINSLSGIKYSPVFSLEGDRVYFCMYNPDAKEPNEDIFYSEISHICATPIKFTNASSAYNESPNCFLTDSSLLLYGDLRNRIGAGDLYIYKQHSNGKFNTFLFPNDINSTFFESDGCVYNDSVLFFVSDRPGVIGAQREKRYSRNPDRWGNTDIFVSFYRNHTWTKPINLGSDINTDKAERSPFLSRDGRTLFFSSNGYKSGSIDLDILVSYRIYDTSWTYWTKPIVLGNRFNSKGDDWGFSFSKDFSFCAYSQDEAIKMFYVSDKPSDLKIKSFVFNTLIDSILAKPTQINDSDFVTIVKNVLPVSPETDTSIEKDNDSLVVTEFNTIVHDTVNKTIYLYFDFNNAQIKPTQYHLIDSVCTLIAVMLKNSYNFDKVSISGHTDSVGTYSFNKNLSKKRALSVKSLLEDRGFKKVRYIVRAMGETDPIDSNNTEYGRRKNRRVEVRIVYK